MKKLSKRAKDETSFIKPFFCKQKKVIGGTRSPNPSFSFGKRGMMDDLFDFLFTVIAAFFILFFISMALGGGAAKAEEKSLAEIDELNMQQVFLSLLSTPFDENENVFDLFGRIDVPNNQKKEKLSKLITDYFRNYYPSKSDVWWIKVFPEDQVITMKTFIYEVKKPFQEKDPDYDCAVYGTSRIINLFITRENAKDLKFVFCLSTPSIRENIKTDFIKTLK